MEIRDDVRSVYQVAGGFPSVLIFVETLPMDKILHRVTKAIGPPGIFDEVDLPFFLIVDQGGVWWRWRTLLWIDRGLEG